MRGNDVEGCMRLRERESFLPHFVGTKSYVRAAIDILQPFDSGSVYFHFPEPLEAFPMMFPGNRTETQYRGTRTPGDFVATEFPGHATVNFLKLSDSGSVYFH